MFREKESVGVPSVAPKITAAKEDSVVECSVTNVWDVKDDSQKAIAEVIMAYI